MAKQADGKGIYDQLGYVNRLNMEGLYRMLKFSSQLNEETYVLKCVPYKNTDCTNVQNK